MHSTRPFECQALPDATGGTNPFLDTGFNCEKDVVPNHRVRPVPSVHDYLPQVVRLLADEAGDKNARRVQSNRVREQYNKRNSDYELGARMSQSVVEASASLFYSGLQALQTPSIEKGVGPPRKGLLWLPMSTGREQSKPLPP